MHNSSNKYHCLCQGEIMSVCLQSYVKLMRPQNCGHGDITQCALQCEKITVGNSNVR